MATNTPHLGSLLRDARTRTGLTQPRLAQQLTEATGDNVHPTAVSKMESGTRPPTLAEAAALTHLLGIKPGDLLAAVPTDIDPRGEQRRTSQTLRTLAREARATSASIFYASEDMQDAEPELSNSLRGRAHDVADIADHLSRMDTRFAREHDLPLPDKD